MNIDFELMRGTFNHEFQRTALKFEKVSNGFC